MTEAAPAKPILALTLALAGKRTIPEAARLDLTDALALAFDAVSKRLGALRDMASLPDDPLAARFDAARTARLTLVTGLADGVDQMAGRIFLEAPAVASVDRVLGAVIPCRREAFLDHSKVEDQTTFQHQAAQCAFVVELDGDMPEAPRKPASLPDGTQPPPTREETEKARARAEAFRAQSEVLLRQSDILVAVDNPLEPSRAGGTRETIQGALDLGIPVILLHVGEPGLAVLRTRGDLDEPVMLPPGAAYHMLARLVDDLIGPPPATGENAYAAELFEQFFADGLPRAGWLNHLWSWFDTSFKSDDGPISHHLGAIRRWFEGKRTASGTTGTDGPDSPYDAYKLRASDLTSYYAGRYRGSFLAGYGLAVIAVIAAVASLALLPGIHASLSDPWWWFLFALGLIKVVVVWGILRLAWRANDGRLSHRAADYRYLSERLRAMTYLPRAGCLRSPVSWSLPYTTRVAAQGVMDQLFAAIVRQAEPLHAMVEATEDGETVVRPDAGAALQAIREKWLAGQIDYHQGAHIRLKAMSRWLERLTRRINLAVILIAVADVMLLLAEVFHLLPCVAEGVAHDVVSPWLIAFAAILPAAVASLNGVRFQSECTRFADRSARMAGELARLRFQAGIAGPRPIRIADALHMADDTARLTLDEVAEWSAIYGKEFVEM
jgi:hypothetical protein